MIYGGHSVALFFFWVVRQRKHEGSISCIVYLLDTVKGLLDTNCIIWRRSHPTDQCATVCICEIQSVSVSMRRTLIFFLPPILPLQVCHSVAHLHYQHTLVSISTPLFCLIFLLSVRRFASRVRQMDIFSLA